MRAFHVRAVRLAIGAGAIAGSSIVSSVALATDDAPPIDEPVLVVVPESVGALPTADPPVTDLPPTEAPPAGPIDAESMVIEVPSDAVLDSVIVIELVPTDMNEPGPGSATDGPVAVHTDASPAALFSAEPGDGTWSSSVVDPLDDGDDGDHGGDKVGEGTPYLMAFDVVWSDIDGTPIGVLDRSSFELFATSLTGMGSTSATCTYPAGGDVLHCVFEGADHESGSDGLIIPGSRSATYDVTVRWPSTDWTVEHANDGPYSARALCPRGGGGGAGGDDHGDDHGEDHGDDQAGGQEGGEEGGERNGEKGGRTTFPCPHIVTMHLMAPPVGPPPVQPDPEVTPPPAAVPEVGAAPPVVAVASQVPSAASPRALPATGGSVSMVLLLGAVLVATGAALTRLTARG